MKVVWIIGILSLQLLISKSFGEEERTIQKRSIVAAIINLLTKDNPSRHPSYHPKYPLNTGSDTSTQDTTVTSSQDSITTDSSIQETTTEISSNNAVATDASSQTTAQNNTTDESESETISNSDNTTASNDAEATTTEDYAVETVTSADCINDVCGLSSYNCSMSKYRTYDGSCNNLLNPSWGTTNLTFNRLLPAKYSDGIHKIILSTSGEPLPSARLISTTLFHDVHHVDPVWTLNAMQYGQFIAHDMNLASPSTPTDCCSEDGQLLDPEDTPEQCLPITVPENDVQYLAVNKSCMIFSRTLTNKDANCSNGEKYLDQINSVNSYLDLSLIYGNDEESNTQLREFKNGYLYLVEKSGTYVLPRAYNPNETCDISNSDEACYRAGDVRVNQNPQLTVLHTIFAREHNRICDELAEINPHWDDEKLFQEARMINIGQHEQIAYYEWLPIFIGQENARRSKIISKEKGFADVYDETVDATVLNEHTTAAYRYFHSLIAGKLELTAEDRSTVSFARLSDHFNRPAILEVGDNFDHLCRGLQTQHQLKSDIFHDSEISQFLLRGENKFGGDLQAITIQRGRDHGLPSYNDFREYYGLKRAHKFKDFSDLICNKKIRRLERLYNSTDDVELFVGGALENHVPGTLAGPVFLNILSEQFYRTKFGDKYWFENNRHDGFTLPQLLEIRNASISRLFCDNAHNVTSMQRWGFEVLSENNPLLPCTSLPTVNLTLWQESNVTTTE